MFLVRTRNGPVILEVSAPRIGRNEWRRSPIWQAVRPLSRYWAVPGRVSADRHVAGSRPRWLGNAPRSQMHLGGTLVDVAAVSATVLAGVDSREA
jgi:hypothetical protein